MILSRSMLIGTNGIKRMSRLGALVLNGQHANVLSSNQLSGQQGLACLHGQRSPVMAKCWHHVSHSRATRNNLVKLAQEYQEQSRQSCWNPPPECGFCEPHVFIEAIRI